MMYKKMYRMHEAYNKFIKDERRSLKLGDLLEMIDLAEDLAEEKGGYNREDPLDRVDNYMVAIVGYKCGYSTGYDESLKEERGTTCKKEK